MNKRQNSNVVLVMELILTVLICAVVVMTNISSVKSEAVQYTSEIAADYSGLSLRYTSVFKAIAAQVGEEIEKDPGFDEMNEWLRQHDEDFRQAVGSDVYDGFAMSYKGGYAHSWDYGDYSKYDPATRPWYQEAQKAGGEVAVVAPYISYLGSSYLKSDQIVIMTITQKYSDDISFDLDIKISEMNSLMSRRTTKYSNLTSLLFDRDGYILSTNSSGLYCHNINTPDDAVTGSLSWTLRRAQDNPGSLELAKVDGALSFIYADKDELGNTYCVVIPFGETFVRDFLFTGIGLLLLIMLEVAIHSRNRRVIEAMTERENLISRISRAAFEKQIYVDIDTMKCAPDENSEGMIRFDDYRAVYTLLRGDLADPSAADEFCAALSPEAITRLKNSVLKTGKFAFDLVSGGEKTRRILELSVFACDLGGRRTAVILGNDVTDRELKQQHMLRAIAHHYAGAMTGNAETGRIDVIKLDKYYQAVYDPAAPVEEIHARFAREYLREEYIQPYLDAVSLDTICRRLSESEDYSITVGLKNGHWHTVKLFRGDDYAESREFVFSVESADEQMRQQEELKVALRQATEATEAKTDFLSRMSHDIRTPMNGIIGMTGIALEQPNPPKTADCLKKISISSNYLLGLINDILDMTRIESGEIKLYPEPYPAEEFMQYLDSVVRPLCEAKKQTFVITDHSDPGHIPLLDKLRVNQIVFNLLSNAVKYTPAGGTVEYRVDESIRGDIIDIRIKVWDNGRGMSPEFQKILFLPFSQEDRVRGMDTMSSTGLGLAIVKKLVDLMGGSIELVSRENTGSSFTILIPAAYVDAAHYSAQTAGDAARNESLLRGRRVLLCEDNAINQEIARALLERVGIQVELAENGLAGVRMFSASAPGYYDCVLMDIRMPLMDGYEAAQAIRALDRADAQAPIIAMTADAFDADVQRCLDAGMNGHIPKPLDPQNMYSTLAAWLQAKTRPQ